MSDAVLYSNDGFPVDLCLKITYLLTQDRLNLNLVEFKNMPLLQRINLLLDASFAPWTSLFTSFTMSDEGTRLVPFRCH